MKKFLVKILWFTLILLLAAIVLDCVISFRLLDNKNRMFAGWNAMYNDTTNYDLIINGSSRAWTQYDPIIIDSILNINSYILGIDGSAINRQIVRYRKYREYHKPAKYLIQNIDFINMHNTFGYEREQFFPYFLYDRNLMRQIDIYENFSFAEKFIPSYRYIGYKDVLTEALFNYSSQNRFEFLYKGYFGNNSNWNGVELAQLDSIVFSCDTMALGSFIEFLEQITYQSCSAIHISVYKHYPRSWCLWNNFTRCDHGILCCNGN
jgi:hypothetical protein